MAPPAWAYQPEYFVTPPDEELICSICCLVFRDPTECSCRHAFCHSCIHQWLRRNRDCPICRKPVTVPVSASAPFIRNLISNMKMRCHNKESGCDVIFALEACEHHLKECQFELVRCACGVSVMRKDEQEHNSACFLHGPDKILPPANNAADIEEEKHQIERELRLLGGKAIGKMAVRIPRPPTSSACNVGPALSFPSTSSYNHEQVGHSSHDDWDKTCKLMNEIETFIWHDSKYLGESAHTSGTQGNSDSGWHPLTTTGISPKKRVNTEPKENGSRSKVIILNKSAGSSSSGASYLYNPTVPHTIITTPILSENHYPDSGFEAGIMNSNHSLPSTSTATGFESKASTSFQPPLIPFLPEFGEAANSVNSGLTKRELYKLVKNDGYPETLEAADVCDIVYDSRLESTKNNISESKNSSSSKSPPTSKGYAVTRVKGMKCPMVIKKPLLPQTLRKNYLHPWLIKEPSNQNSGPSSTRYKEFDYSTVVGWNLALNWKPPPQNSQIGNPAMLELPPAYYSTVANTSSQYGTSSNTSSSSWLPLNNNPTQVPNEVQAFEELFADQSSDQPQKSIFNYNLWDQ